MVDATLHCDTSRRRDQLRLANGLPSTPVKWNGIEHVEYDPEQKSASLRVYFLCGFPERLDTTKLPHDSAEYAFRCDSVRIMDEDSRRRIPVTGIKPSGENCAEIQTPTLCCSHSYTLSIIRPDDFDPQYAQFHFVATACTTDIDPRPQVNCAPQTFEEPRINYLARDYASFRQLLLDRLAQTTPEWKERHTPDLGMTLVELFAYVGDYLSYHQDAVATEAYLNTARQRISVRRHVRLVDYQLHEGCNARTFLHIAVNADTELNPRDAYFITEHPDNELKDVPILSEDVLADLPANSFQPFEALHRPVSCPRLKCEDITNAVGLIACMVTGTHAVSSFLFDRFPAAVQDQVRQYAMEGMQHPSASLSETLMNAINAVVTQHQCWKCVDFAHLISSESWKRWQARLGRGCDADCNVGLIKESLPDYFSRFESTRISLRPALNTIHFYSWNQFECCLPEGATSATLFDGSCDSGKYPIPAPIPENSAGPPKEDGTCCGNAPSRTIAPATATVPSGGDPFAEEDTARIARDNIDRHATERPYDDHPTICSPYVAAHLCEWQLKSLSPGDYLIFEERIGPQTHNPADANPNHRQAVRLTRVTFCIDPVTRARLVEIEWGSEDALRFPLCISSVGPYANGCEERGDISVARGNIILVDHGLSLNEPEWLGETFYSSPPPSCRSQQLEDNLIGLSTRIPRSEIFQPRLKEADLTFASPLRPGASAQATLMPEAHEALPAIQVIGLPVADEPVDSERADNVPPPTLFGLDDLDVPYNVLQRARSYSVDAMRRLEGMLPAPIARFFQESQTAAGRARVDQLRSHILSTNSTCDNAQHLAATDADLPADYDKFKKSLRAAVGWESRMNLLDSEAIDQHFVVEIDNERRTSLRFGDDDLGRRPPDGLSFYARYRRGNGVAGNVGADKIKHLVFRREMLGAIASVRNPLPSVGGVEPESLDHARVHAPHQFKKLRRAITADDYVEITLRDFGTQVQKARASLHWMGTWYEVAVAIDPRDEVRDTTALIDAIQCHLERYRRIGHLLKVNLPQFVALQIEMTVCVRSSYLKAHVERELLQRFSNGRLADGTNAFFHPDNFSFGDALYLSRIIQEAKKVPGVENVDVTRFERRDQGPQGELDAGLITFGTLEIPRLDNDPLRPENGSFLLRMEGLR